MPAVVHFQRLDYTNDQWGDRSYNGTHPACGSEADAPKMTRKKAQVTCKRCRRKLGLKDAAAPATARKPGARTAWDHLDDLDGPEPAPVPPPTADEIVRDALPPPIDPVLGPTALTRRNSMADVEHRISLVFYHLMHSHLGMTDVEQLADLASRGVTGGRDDDLQARADRFARMIVEPVFLTR